MKAIVRSVQMLILLSIHVCGWSQPAEPPEAVSDEVEGVSKGSEPMRVIVERAQKLMVQGENAQARDQLQAYLEEGRVPPESAAVIRLTAAQCLFNQGDNDSYREEARPLLAQQDLLTAESRAQLKYHLAMADFRQGRYGEAQASLEQLMAEGVAGTSVDGWAQYHAAMCRLNQGDEDGFRKMAEAELARKDDATTEAQALMGLDLARMPMRHGQLRDAQSALKAFAEAHAGSPVAERALAESAICLFDAGDFVGFKPEAEAFLKEHPGAPLANRDELTYRIARLGLHEGRWDEAHRALHAFAAERPDAPQALMALSDAAQCLFNKQDLGAFVREAEALLKRPEAAQPGQLSGLRYHLAMVPAMQGEWAKAAEQLGRFLEQPGMDLHMQLTASMQRSFALHRQAEVTRAEGLVERADELELLCDKQVDDFRTSATEVVLGYPDQGTRREAAAWLMESWQELGDPATLAEKAGELAGRTPEGSLEWGVAMSWLGLARTQLEPSDPAGAAEAFDAVIAADIRDPNLADHLPTNAIYWRWTLARQQGDEVKTEELIRKLRDEMPEGPVKESILKSLAESARAETVAP